MTKSRFAKPLAAAVALASFSIPAVALAGTLVPVKQTFEPVVPTNTVENSRLKTTAPVLGARSPKPNGGYTLNPVCIAGDKVYGGTVEYQYYKWRVKCPNGGKAITNPGDYTTEAKNMIQQRGSLSVATLTYTYGTLGQRVICYGKIGSNVMPGWMDMPQPGQLPTACNVEVWGNSVAATDFGVFKYANPGSFPSGNGWWQVTNTSVTSSNLPVYTRITMNPHEGRICRGKVGNIYYPGTLEQSGSVWKCRLRTPSGASVTSNFQLYLNPKNPKTWMTTGPQNKNTVDWNRGLNVNNSSMPVYLCRQHTTKLYGMVVNTPSSDKKCVVNSTYASKQPAATDSYNLMFYR